MCMYKRIVWLFATNYYTLLFNNFLSYIFTVLIVTRKKSAGFFNSTLQSAASVQLVAIIEMYNYRYAQSHTDTNQLTSEQHSRPLT